MTIVTKILWKLISQQDRRLLLGYVPAFERRNIERIVNGRAKYHRVFDDNNCLFIHIPKSAGRSIVRGLFDVKSVEHAPAHWYEAIDKDKFDRYFKFTFVRNPWDRAVSAFTYLKAGGGLSNTVDSQWSEFLSEFNSFDEFVCNWLNEDNMSRHELFVPQRDYLLDKFGRISIDFIGHFETIEKDFRTICGRLGIEAKLPHINQSKVRHYSSYYSEQSTEIVADLYREDIALFNYKFDSGDS